MDIGILGISYHLPSKVETNEDLSRENPEWQLGEFGQKAGIHARHIAAPDETASDLGYCAAARLIERALVPVDEIDYLVYCTQCPDYYLPPGACILQNRVGLGRHVGAFDINLGCSGYVYGLQIAKSLVESGAARNVMLVTADTFSKVVHPRDASVRPLFGDGASATLVGANGLGKSIGSFVVGTDGTGAKNLIVPSGGFRLPRSSVTGEEFVDAIGQVRSQDHLFMDGSAIFAFAITTVPNMIRELLGKTGLESEQMDWYVYHQANRFMLLNLAIRNRVPEEKMVIELSDVGNTSSSSIPIAIQRWVEAGRIRQGHRLMLIGFGVGYSWAACDVVW